MLSGIRQHLSTYRQLGDLLRAYLSDWKAFGPTDQRVQVRGDQVLLYVREHPEAFE